jgi:hypothetical protein
MHCILMSRWYMSNYPCPLTCIFSCLQCIHKESKNAVRVWSMIRIGSSLSTDSAWTDVLACITIVKPQAWTHCKSILDCVYQTNITYFNLYQYCVLTEIILEKERRLSPRTERTRLVDNTSDSSPELLSSSFPTCGQLGKQRLNRSISVCTIKSKKLYSFRSVPSSQHSVCRRPTRIHLHPRWCFEERSLPGQHHWAPKWELTLHQLFEIAHWFPVYDSAHIFQNKYSISTEAREYGGLQLCGHFIVKISQVTFYSTR